MMNMWCSKRGCEVCQCGDTTKTVSGNVEGIDPHWIQAGDPVRGLKPHKCPVCEGRGLVSPMFYEFGIDGTASPVHTTPQQCRACKGQGWLMLL